MGKIINGILLFTAILLLQTPKAQSQTIVNVEKLQAQAKPGWFAGLSADFDLEKGNSEVLEIEGQSIIGYEQRRHAIKLFTGLRFLSEDQNTITSRSFLQLRYNYIFNNRYRTFSFYQYQQNKDLILKSRQLIGAGLRRKFGTAETLDLHLGAGLMYEDEKLDEEQLFPDEASNTNVLRLNAIAFFSHQIGTNSTLLNSTYYQPAVSDFSDFRLLNEMSLEVAIKEYLDLTFSFVWRYDNNPPQILKKSDINITSGLTIHL
ncbi:hypothetical protein CK503_04875 [Aliifodinibius salipaludis]|uniref:DUF481 domain-containing protein n=1 Tax=Fodinibius salipaludis TaxID=2032627 RepID=A0A2A2GD60_9BACT|nr:DUF481 domain-containing protein [Aliifodinibius salipaludis]PAU94809.1 hypothetical protein CK503_04875 [Aliifodinibius salipaludis]